MSGSMSEMDGMLEKRAELSAANLRRTTMIGFVMDVIVAVLFIVLKDTIGIGDIAYVVASLLVAWGLLMLLIFPRLPGWGLRRYRRKLGLIDQKWDEEKEK
jgi:uncharacterized MAPEG superfamily protein